MAGAPFAQLFVPHGARPWGHGTPIAHGRHPYNQFLNRVQVIPLTGNVEKLYPSEAYVTFRGKPSKAMADQLTTVRKKRLINKAGGIAPGEMEGIVRAISTQLDL